MSSSPIQDDVIHIISRALVLEGLVEISFKSTIPSVFHCFWSYTTTGLASSQNDLVVCATTTGPVS